MFLRGLEIFFQLSLLSLLIVLIILYLYQKYSRFFTKIKQLPSTPAMPILGHALEWNLSPAAVFKQIRCLAKKYYPIWAVHAFHMGGAIILHPEDAKKLLMEPKYEKKGFLYNMLEPWLQGGLLLSTAPKHTARRKILTFAFHFTMLQRFVPIFNKVTHEFIENLEKYVDEPYVEIAPFASDLTIEAIAETAMGVKLDADKSSQEYKKAVCDFSEMFAFRAVRPWYYNNFIFNLTTHRWKFQKIVRTLHEFTLKVIKEREVSFLQEAEKEPDKHQIMLDILLAAKFRGENIDYQGIREEVDIFMFGGYDTTASAIIYLLFTLANHPKEQELCYQEIMSVLGSSSSDPTYNDLQKLPYLDRCIKEVLRLFPSVPHIIRNLTDDFVTVTEHVIPKGADILVPIYDLHRTPDIYPNPEKFDPDRFLQENCQKRHPFSYIPFSAGIRNCIGQKYAMFELKAVLCGVLRKFRLEPMDTFDNIVFEADLMLKTDKNLRIKIVTREN